MQWLYTLRVCMSHYIGPNKALRFYVHDPDEQKCVMFDILEPVLQCPEAVPHGPCPPREMKGYENQGIAPRMIADKKAEVR